MGGREVSAFNKASRDTAAAQSELLLDIVNRSSQSAYGKEHDFKSIKSISDFRRAVPVNDYESLKSYIMRSAEGEASVLTGENPFMFATTSGTTGDRKLIPVTRSFIREFRRASVVSGYNLFKEFPSVKKGVALSVFSPAEESRTGAGIPCGAISGRLYHEEPPLIKRYISPIPYECFVIPDYESRYYTILRCALVLPVSVIYTLNPSTILMLGKKLETYSEQLIKDVRDGTVSPPEALPSHVIDALKPFMRRNPLRARELSALMNGGTLKAPSVWENLTLISCWTKAAASFYLEDFSSYFNGISVRDITYGASEGRGTVTVGPNRQALAIRSHFFEFVEQEAFEKGSRETLLAHELSQGKTYYILFTTSAGLYRYHINDLVKVVGWHNGTPLIDFLHKGGNISSFTGEKITESQVTAAMQEAVRGLKLKVRFFSVLPVFRPEPHYELVFELDGDGADRVGDQGSTGARSTGSAQSDIEHALARAFDEGLALANIEYRAKRESLRLAPVVVRRLMTGAYERIRRRLVESGVPDAQVKVSHLNPKEAVRSLIESEISQLILAG